MSCDSMLSDIQLHRDVYSMSFKIHTLESACVSIIIKVSHYWFSSVIRLCPSCQRNSSPRLECNIPMSASY